MKRPVILAALAVLLSGCGGGGGSSTPSPFAGTWFGAYVIPASAQSGVANVTVASNGTVSGTGRNTSLGADFTINGTISNAGVVKGTISGDLTGSLNGTLRIFFVSSSNAVASGLWPPSATFLSAFWLLLSAHRQAPTAVALPVSYGISETFPRDERTERQEPPPVALPAVVVPELLLVAITGKVPRARTDVSALHRTFEKAPKSSPCRCVGQATDVFDAVVDDEVPVAQFALPSLTGRKERMPLPAARRGSAS